MKSPRKFTVMFAALLLAMAVPVSAARLGFEASFEGQRSGLDAELSQVVVTKVLDDSPAERGGLRLGDVIEQMNGAPVAGRSSRDFYRSMSSLQPGETVVLTVLRSGDRLTVRLVAEEP